MNWTVGAVTHALREHLSARGFDDARLDAELLVASVLGCSRTHLYIYPEKPVTDLERDKLRALSRRRAQHEPLAYILGEKEFFGHALVVTPDVLIPRPETEHLVEVASKWLKECGPENPRILDVGCGSGAVAIALAHACPGAEIIASDISAKALAVAQENINRHALGERITLVEADVFDTRASGHAVYFQTPFDVIVSNPPYVRQRDGHRLDPGVHNFEPHQALFGGDDGLSILRRLCAEAPSHLATTGFFALEMGFDQAREVGALLGTAWTQKTAVRDLAGHWRIACAWRGASFCVTSAKTGEMVGLDDEPFAEPQAPAASDALATDTSLPSFDIEHAAQVVSRHSNF